MHIWGPPSPVQRLAERIAMYLSPPLFPVRLADIPSRITFHDAPDEQFDDRRRDGHARRTSPTRARPSGYRIEEDGRSLAYIPDHEPSLGVDLPLARPAWI